MDDVKTLEPQNLYSLYNITISLETVSGDGGSGATSFFTEEWIMVG